MSSKRFYAVSVVVNTDGRAAALRNTIESFRHLDYPNFEVVVVCGPTPDGTRDVAQEYAAKGWIKYFECPERNLSRSRNIGIQKASGDIVAFIDDDGIPEPEWLIQLVTAFDDPEVGGAGGLVFDHTGYTYQYLYAACNRLGEAILNLKAPAEEYNFPFSEKFPYVQGTNSAFRREALVGVGGFDEEYEFYLDETDVCCRMVDAGLKIRQLDNAVVHHKFLPSNIRNEHRVTTVKFPVIKNKIYFSFVNNHGHHSLADVLGSAVRFSAEQRRDLEFHVNGGRLRPTDLEAFDEDQERALRVGLTRGLSGKRLTRPPEFFAITQPFRVFPRLVPRTGARRVFAFLSQSYPPEHSGGNARHTYDIARSIASFGHTVHVLTRGSDLNRVDFEEGVWVHRILPKAQHARVFPGGVEPPEHIWNYSATQLEELYRISKFRRIDAVEGVSWDCECIALVLDGHFPSATNIVTALSHWLDTHEHLRADVGWMRRFGEPMLKIEKSLYELSPGIVSASRAIAESIAERYGVTFQPDQIGFMPHGMVDVSAAPRRPVGTLKVASGGKLRQPVLFVGRLELRKGVDVLLAAAPRFLTEAPDAELWIAGDDTLEIEPGVTMRSHFEASDAYATFGDRVRFLGRVSDAELRWLYSQCAVFVSPSRFESFGLIFVEAMMFGKPCVGCRAGGIPEVVEDGVTGLLSEPGDASSLADALVRILGNSSLRDLFGTAGRARYERLFEARAVAGRRIEFLSKLARNPITDWDVIGAIKHVDTGYNQKAIYCEQQSGIVFAVKTSRLYLTFWKHAWSGIATLTVNDVVVARFDLYAPEGYFETFEVAVETDVVSQVVLLRVGEKREESNDTELIVLSIEAAV